LPAKDDRIWQLTYRTNEHTLLRIMSSSKRVWPNPTMLASRRLTGDLDIDFRQTYGKGLSKACRQWHGKSASSTANRQGAAHVFALRMNRAFNALIGVSAPIDPTSV
jgi:hypothetical protein